MQMTPVAACDWSVAGKSHARFHPVNARKPGSAAATS